MKALVALAKLPSKAVKDPALDVILRFRIETGSGSHNTVCGADGSRAYLAGLRSPLLSVFDTKARRVAGTVGPFAAAIRPFTVNGSQTLCFVTVNDLLGFEVGDLRTGKKLCRVEVEGFRKGPTKRHGCPSHGVGLTPDEKEVWVCDAANSRVHVFDLKAVPPRQVASILLREQPGNEIRLTCAGRKRYDETYRSGWIGLLSTHGMRNEDAIANFV